MEQLKEKLMAFAEAIKKIWDKIKEFVLSVFSKKEKKQKEIKYGWVKKNYLYLYCWYVVKKEVFFRKLLRRKE